MILAASWAANIRKKSSVPEFRFLLALGAEHTICVDGNLLNDAKNERARMDGFMTDLKDHPPPENSLNPQVL